MMRIHLEYFAALREQAGCDGETVEVDDRDAQALYRDLAAQYRFTLTVDDLKLAINDEFVRWSHPLNDGDKLVFIPPVSGG